MSSFSSINRDQLHFELLEDCYIHRATDKAVQVTFEGDLYWIPKSLIKDGTNLEKWYQGDLEVRAWFALQEGMI